jgi:DDE superfamily endonuclease
VFLAYASQSGHALIDRALYLPRSWTDDRDRCQQAGIPDGVEFISKPRQAQAMISRAIQGGVPFGWFTGDEVYGQAKWLQTWLEENGGASTRPASAITGDEATPSHKCGHALPPPRAQWNACPVPGPAVSVTALRSPCFPAVSPTSAPSLTSRKSLAIPPQRWNVYA